MLEVCIWRYINRNYLGESVADSVARRIKLYEINKRKVDRNLATSRSRYDKRNQHVASPVQKKMSISLIRLAII